RDLAQLGGRPVPHRRLRRHELDRGRPVDVPALVLAVEHERGRRAGSEEEEREKDEKGPLHAADATASLCRRPATPSVPSTRTRRSVNMLAGTARPSVVVVAPRYPAALTAAITVASYRPDG